MKKFLYRGVSMEMHNSGDGFKPKGASLTREAQHGEKYATHGNIEHGSSIGNAIVAHQTSSEKFPSSGVSTTPHFEIARKYAIHNSVKGVVYKMDTDRFLENEIEVFVVAEWVSFPKLPQDEEVILRRKDDNRIGEEIIIETIEVEP